LNVQVALTSKSTGFVDDIVGAIISHKLSVTFVINQLLSASNQSVQNHRLVVVHTGMVAFHNGEIL